MIRVMLTLALAAFLASCGNTGVSSDKALAFDTTGYQLEDYPGNGFQRAIKLDDQGYIMEEGILRNGVQEGEWIIFNPATPFPAKIISFVGGAYNGPYMEFNERGQLTLRATYKNNKLNGPWGKYSFGRPEIEVNYKDGELDGTYSEYDTRSGKIQKEVSYKNGKMHGRYRFYNEKGEVTVEYEYRDGEKISGGIIEDQEGQ